MSVVAELPNRRVEGWRWSDLRAAVGAEFPPVAREAESAPPEHPVWSKLGAEIVFVDGRISIWPEGELVAGVDAQAMQTEHADPPRTTPNVSVAMLAADGVPDDWFPILKSTETEGVAVVRHTGTSDAHLQSTRVGVSVQPGQTLTLIEIFEENLRGVANALTECFVEGGGTLKRIVIQPQNADATLVSTAQAFLEDGAQFKQFVLTLGGKLSRVQTDVMAGADIDASIDGVCLAASGLHADQTSHVTLQAEGAEVRQLVRSAARRKGRGVFQGKFLVERAAQKTDAQMEHNALLLEDSAEIFAKPELEIYADDVQCAHGNTCGQLDENAVFYARQRGLPEAEARALLTRAFLVEAIPDWLADDLRAEVETRIDEWLAAS